MAPEDLLDQLERLEASLRCRAPALPQRSALDRFEALLPQAQGALSAARERSDAVAAMRLLGALARFLWMRGRTRAGLLEADATLALARSAPCDPRSMRSGWFGAAQIYYAAAAYDQAREALAMLGEDDPDATNLLGMIEREQGRYEPSASLHRRALALYEHGADRWGQAHAISNLAVCSFRAGNARDALDLHRQALALRRGIQDTLGIASSLGNLALLHATTGQPKLALPLYAESLALREALGDAWGVAGSCVALAAAEVACGRPRRALPLLLRASEGFERVGDRLGFAETAEVTAAALLALGDRPSAARALGAADGAREAIAAPVPASHRDQHRRLERELSPHDEPRREGREDGRRGDPLPLRQALRRALRRRCVTLAVAITAVVGLTLLVLALHATHREG